MNQLIINKIADYFTYKPIGKAWVFGSYARAEENKQSDIDILVSFCADTKITLFQYAHTEYIKFFINNDGNNFDITDHFELYDVNGIKIIEQKITSINLQLNVENLTNGMYFIFFRKNEKIVYKSKIIKI